MYIVGSLEIENVRERKEGRKIPIKRRKIDKMEGMWEGRSINGMDNELVDELAK